MLAREQRRRGAALAGMAAAALLGSGCSPSASGEGARLAGADGPTAGAGSASDAPGDFDGELGLATWKQLCASCHGDFAPGSTLSSGNMNGDFRLDASAAIERHGDGLEGYIEAAMPMGSPELCTGTCAELLGAYLRSLNPPGALSCSGESGPAMGARQVVLLSSREYQNALEDLLDVPTDYGEGVANHDGRRGGFVDMTGQLVSSTLLDSYRRNAEAVAAWALQNGRPFACDDASACANRFVDEFLPRAFRGPVSDAQKDAYRKLFADYPDEALELSLRAALTSPMFLYRIEVGVELEQARAAGYYDPGATKDTGIAPAEAASEIHSPSQFAAESNGYLNGEAWMLDQNGRIVVAFNTPFSDPSSVEVMARGENHGETWPEMIFRVNGSEFGRQRVDSLELRSHRFDITGIEGAARVEIAFENDSGVPPYGSGEDANLLIEEVRLFTEAGGPTPTPEPAPAPTPSSDAAGGLLDEADSDAFVLTPFELASALAFRVTGSTPDQQLLEAARTGRLASRANIRAQVERLIDSPRGRAQMARFVTRWFRLDELQQVSRPEVPELTAEVKAAMLEEVATHFLHVFYDESVAYSEFFGGDYTFLNATLAQFYGIPGQFGDSFQQTQVEGRGGPLASGAFMTVNAHADRTAPILRAVRARQTALCHYIDPPNSPIAGDDIDAQRAAAQQRVTEREQTEGTLSSREFYFLYTDGIDACAGCHERIINPMFGMEDFDNVGRLRQSAGATTVIEMVHGAETLVSTEGTLHGVTSTSDPTTLEYAGAKDLSNQLADTDAIGHCLARKAFRFLTDLTYVDRDLDATHQEVLTAAQRNAYSCVAARALQAYEAGGQSPRALFIELATDSMLLFRR
ncbi:MAG: DUF1592 domain-containing protein [Myxococcales bacterium]|nr:DUF1592 domain-containing protein [Myxococcales bacterium]